MNALGEFRKWAARHADLQTAWNECARADWMAWIVAVSVPPAGRETIHSMLNEARLVSRPDIVGTIREEKLRETTMFPDVYRAMDATEYANIVRSCVVAGADIAAGETAWDPCLPSKRRQVILAAPSASAAGYAVAEGREAVEHESVFCAAYAAVDPLGGEMAARAFLAHQRASAHAVRSRFPALL